MTLREAAEQRAPDQRGWAPRNSARFRRRGSQNPSPQHDRNFFGEGLIPPLKGVVQLYVFFLAGFLLVCR